MRRGSSACHKTRRGGDRHHTGRDQGRGLSRLPSPPPGGETVLFRVNLGNAGHLKAVSLATENARSSGVGDNARPLYVSLTPLVYSQGREVFAAPFDAQSARLTGRGIPVLTDIETPTQRGAHRLAVSQSAPSPTCPDRGCTKPAWRGRTVRVREDVDLEAALYGGLHLAPDGGVSPSSRQRESRWRSSPSLSGEESSTPSWRTPSTTLILCSRPVAAKSRTPRSRGGLDLLVIDLDAGAAPRRLGPSRDHRQPKSWSPDGRFLAYRQTQAGRGLRPLGARGQRARAHSLPDCRFSSR